MNRKLKFPMKALAWVVLVALGAGACAPAPAASKTPQPTRPRNAVVINIVTNDTKADWLRAVTEPFNKSATKTSAGRQIVVDIVQEASPQPTVDKLVAGKMQPILWSPADISWVEQANSLLIAQGKAPIVTQDCPRIVYAATGFAMWRPMAEAMGWPEKPIGWRDIAALAGDPQGWARYGHPEWGQFKFGHSHPEQSSTGFNMLASLAYAAAGKTSGLTPEDVHGQAVVDAFRKVELDTYHYGTSTRGLLTVMAQRGPSYLHAATASETSMLASAENQKANLLWPWAFIFPAEGAFWMDNPACLLEADWVSAEQREAATTYRNYLLAFEQQDTAIRMGLRPAVAGVPLHAPISLDNGTDPRVTPQTIRPFANVSAATQQAIIDVFKETKKKATVVLVLDRSGSMQGWKLDGAVAATNNFVSRLGPSDRVQVMTFDGTVTALGNVEDVLTARESLLQALGAVTSGSGTALNDAVCTAVASAEAARRQDRSAGEQRLYGVAVLTDGQENASFLKDVLTCLPTGEDVEGVKVFTIAYGKDADVALLKKIAERTNGKSFAGDPSTIEQVYLSISAEQ